MRFVQYWHLNALHHSTSKVLGMHKGGKPNEKSWRDSDSGLGWDWMPAGGMILNALTYSILLMRNDMFFLVSSNIEFFHTSARIFHHKSPVAHLLSRVLYKPKSISSKYSPRLGRKMLSLFHGLSAGFCKHQERERDRMWLNKVQPLPPQTKRWETKQMMNREESYWKSQWSTCASPSMKGLFWESDHIIATLRTRLQLGMCSRALIEATCCEPGNSTAFQLWETCSGGLQLIGEY